MKNEQKPHWYVLRQESMSRVSQRVENISEDLWEKSFKCCEKNKTVIIVKENNNFINACKSRTCDAIEYF